MNSDVMLYPHESWNAPAEHTKRISPVALQGQLLLSGRPSLNIARYIQELKAYPYGCLEQTASGLFPSLYTNAAQLKAMGIKGDSDEQRRAAVEIGISAYCKCSVTTAASRYGIKTAGRVLVVRLRD
jgi:uncharacterized protein YfaS (alpha-2-macroglobulin family)